jgi:hypothetical protein
LQLQRELIGIDKQLVDMLMGFYELYKKTTNEQTRKEFTSALNDVKNHYDKHNDPYPQALLQILDEMKKANNTPVKKK